VARVADWLDAHNGSATTVATVVFLVVSVAYLMLTRQLVVEQRRDRAIAHTVSFSHARTYIQGCPIGVARMRIRWSGD
jgi:hypothetical protein